MGGRKPPPQSLRPATIRQILMASQAHTDAEFLIDDSEVTQLTVVAQVIDIITQATNVVYVLDDGTGRLDGKQWLSDVQDGESGNATGIVEKSYVRVMGALKSFGGKRHISLQRIRPVEDYHEVLFHLTEALSVHLLLTRGPPGGGGAPGQQAGHNAYMEGGGASAADKDADLTPLQQAIVRFIRNNPGGKEGVNVAAIARGAMPNQTSTDISDAIDALMERGVIYNTIDENHFETV
ncbi:hypothetical protein BOTBODRAFT_171301 [Botryobasidium botryosum FD-172 SS1]|uniref:Replication protein A C-terminal domain-containing protein n=1 Tax=Botryobasidium botryosum (strain FD-172 SS1) TaxID=930990 RepID=A0A067MRT4_BOTB1|nr:hypothetical protein BOTBODRAFT_171301 [Botryobasidium botryosum FD-172 SS1]